MLYKRNEWAFYQISTDSTANCTILNILKIMEESCSLWLEISLQSKIWRERNGNLFIGSVEVRHSFGWRLEWYCTSVLEASAPRGTYGCAGRGPGGRWDGWANRGRTQFESHCSVGPSAAIPTLCYFFPVPFLPVNNFIRSFCSTK
jgi:hypothetical protein